MGDATSPTCKGQCCGRGDEGSSALASPPPSSSLAPLVKCPVCTHWSHPNCDPELCIPWQTMAYSVPVPSPTNPNSSSPRLASACAQSSPSSSAASGSASGVSAPPPPTFLPPRDYETYVTDRALGFACGACVLRVRTLKHLDTAANDLRACGDELLLSGTSPLSASSEQSLRGKVVDVCEVLAKPLTTLALAKVLWATVSADQVVEGDTALDSPPTTHLFFPPPAILLKGGGVASMEAV